MKNRIYNDFAWECLRRNPQYISDWELFFGKNPTNQEGIQETTKLIQSELDVIAETKWGLMKYINPYESDPTNVFWSQKLSNRSVRVTLSNSGSVKGGYTWGDMSTLPGVKHQILQMYDNTLCVKIFNRNGYFQLFIENTVTLKNDSNIFIPLSIESDICIKNIGLLQGVINNKAEFEYKDKQHLDILKTIDDRKKGFSHKDIASEIFGKELVQNEWSSDSWIRAKTRYRIKKANELINHGYLSFI
jgi:hypothetical protein